MSSRPDLVRARPVSGRLVHLPDMETTKPRDVMEQIVSKSGLAARPGVSVQTQDALLRATRRAVTGSDLRSAGQRHPGSRISAA